MYNADLHAPARWRLRAASIGTGALILTAGGMIIGWAPSAMAGEPKPAPAPKDPKPAPAPKPPKDDPNTTTTDSTSTTTTTSDTTTDSTTADSSTTTAPPAQDDKAAKKAADDAAKAAKKAADDAAKAAKQAADQAKKAAEQAAKNAKNNPQPPTAVQTDGSDNSNANASDNSNASTDTAAPTTPVANGPGVNPGQNNPGNNGDNGNHGQGNNGNGNGGVGQGNNGGNGNHGDGNNAGGNGNGNGNVAGSNPGHGGTAPGQTDGTPGIGNHGQGNNGKAVGHQDGPVTSVVFTDVTSGPTTGPEAWQPFGPVDSDSPLSVLFLGPAAALATSGSSAEGGFAGQTHVLGEKFEAVPAGTAPLTASEMVKAFNRFDKKAKAKAPRVTAKPDEFKGTALTSGHWRSAGNAVPLLALLLLVEILILARRFGRKLVGAGTGAVATAARTAGQIRWA